MKILMNFNCFSKNVEVEFFWLLNGRNWHKMKFTSWQFHNFTVHCTLKPGLHFPRNKKISPVKKKVYTMKEGPPKVTIVQILIGRSRMKCNMTLSFSHGKENSGKMEFFCYAGSVTQAYLWKISRAHALFHRQSRPKLLPLTHTHTLVSPHVHF